MYITLKIGGKIIKGGDWGVLNTEGHGGVSRSNTEFFILGTIGTLGTLGTKGGRRSFGYAQDDRRGWGLRNVCHVMGWEINALGRIWKKKNINFFYVTELVFPFQGGRRGGAVAALKGENFFINII